MVGDDMEISSEHGRNIGDEDIDIDIDLTTGQTDEDYILEDAEPHEGFEDGLQQNTLQDVNTDDLMIDEDDNSYIMDDADVEAESGQMESETAEMRYITGESATDPFADMDPEALVQHTTDVPALVSENSWEEPQQVEGLLSVVEVGTELDESNGASNQTEDLTYAASPKDTANASEEATQHLQPQESVNVSSHAVDEKEPPSPVETAIEAHSPTKEEGNSHTESVQEVVSTKDNTDGDHNNQVEIGNELIPSPNITVVYQGVEYVLFSTSENDDPDSYFLADVSIMHKSLSSFLSSIRDVIQDDLSTEDELCLAVEILGLETDETSASLLKDVTLGRIIDVYQKLLQNDGVEADHPLNIVLSVRPNFISRLSNLTAQAAEGNGLSKVVTWHDESESAEDTAEHTQNESVEGPESDHFPHSEANQVSHGGMNDPEANNSNTFEKDKTSEESQQITKITGAETTDHETGNENQPPNNSEAVTVPAEETFHHAETGGSTIDNNKNEENDLLDYDDEDIHQVSKSDASYAHETEADEDKEEELGYATVDGNYHSESTHPNTESVSEQKEEHGESNVHLDEHNAQLEQDDDSGRYVENSADTEHEDGQPEGHELTGSGDDEAHYPEEVREDDIHDELNYEPESETHDEYTYGSNDFSEQTTTAVDNSDTHAAFEDGNHSNVNHDEVRGQQLPEFTEPDGEDGYKYGGTDEEEPVYSNTTYKERREANKDQDNSPTATSPILNNLSSNGFPFADLVESESATMSANTLEADEIDLGEGEDDAENGNNHEVHSEPKEQEDEIDYDDEDELDVVEHQKTLPPEITPEPKGGSGKRQRADADLEDILDEDSQEAKRPRS